MINIHESPLVPQPDEQAMGHPVDLMQDIPATAAPLEAEADVVADINPESEPESNEDYKDPKYLQVLDKLRDNGFVESKFLGNQGYYIPSKDNTVNLICPNTKTGFLLKFSSSTCKSSDAIEIMALIEKYTNLIEELNIILAGSTTSDTKDRHVNGTN